MNFAGIFLFLLFPIGLFAQDLKEHTNSNISPLTTVKDVHPESKAEQVVKLSNAKVAIADYQLIRNDFPHLANSSEDIIDRWILDQVGYISKPQHAQTTVNSQIPVFPDNRQAFRPPEYGRALIYEVKDTNGKAVGIIDVKGAGGLSPSHKSHSNGVMTLGESLREYSYEKMVTSIVDHSGITNKVVGSYAAIFAGFDVMFEDGSRAPAGLYLRQAHRRLTQVEANSTSQPRGNGWMNKEWREKFRNLLNKYGLFANNNYQGTIDNNLFDFGHYIVRNDLKTTDPRVLIPFEQWGFDNPSGEVIEDVNDRWKFSKRDRPWNWSHDTAKAFVEGKISRHEVWMHHYGLLKPVQVKLSEVDTLADLSLNLGFTIRNCEIPYKRMNKSKKKK